MSSEPVTWYFPFFYWTEHRLRPVLVALGATLGGEPGERELVFASFSLFLMDGDEDDDRPAELMVDPADYDAAADLEAAREVADRLGALLGGAPESDGVKEGMFQTAEGEAASLEASEFADFDEVLDYVEERFGRNESGNDWISTVLGWDDTDRTQLVFIERAQVEDEDWVTLSSAFAPVAGTDPLAAATQGGPLFGVWMDAELGDWVIGVSLPVERLRATTVRHLLFAVAGVADNAELELTGADDR